MLPLLLDIQLNKLLPFAFTLERREGEPALRWTVQNRSAAELYQRLAAGEAARAQSRLCEALPCI